MTPIKVNNFTYEVEIPIIYEYETTKQLLDYINKEIFVSRRDGTKLNQKYVQIDINDPKKIKVFFTIKEGKYA